VEESAVVIFFVGLALFALGMLLNWAGWSLHKRAIKEVSTEGFFKWFLNEVKKWYPLLTGPNSTFGQRLAAFGAILSALGILAAVVGLVAWAAA
jgi:hypothetical protein